MKQLIFLLALFISLSAFAQEGTSLEEYRYLSKGYVYQIEMGLDAQKEGYRIKNLLKTGNGTELVGLFQLGNEAPRALLVVMDNGKDKTNYICIPNGTADERVRKLAANDQNNLSASEKVKYQVVLNEFLFAALSNPELKPLAYQSPMSSPMVSHPKDETLVSRSANLDQFINKSPQVPTIEPETTSMTNAKAAKTTISGEIANRTIIQSEEAYANAQKKGVVAVKICVDMEGRVIRAKFTQKGSTTFNSYLKKVALNAAKNLKFAKLDVAEQCGIVNYKF